MCCNMTDRIADTPTAFKAMVACLLTDKYLERYFPNYLVELLEDECTGNLYVLWTPDSGYTDQVEIHPYDDNLVRVLTHSCWDIQACLEPGCFYNFAMALFYSH